VRNGDRATSWEWTLEGSNDGLEWTKVDLKKTVNPNILDNYWVLMSYRADQVPFDYIRIRFPQDIYDWRTLLDSVVVDVNTSDKSLVNTSSEQKTFIGIDDLNDWNNVAGKSSNAKLEYSIVYQDEKIANVENFSLAPGFIAYKISKGNFLRFYTADLENLDLTFTVQGSDDGIAWSDI
jgi:hypothetical protein